MGANSKIEWCDHTGNLWWGCEEVHEGCDNCYAKYLSDVRYKHNLWGSDNPRKAVQSVWSDFITWQAEAAYAGEIRRVFVGSMMDIFEKPKPFTNWKGVPAIDSSDGSPICTDFLRDRFFNEIVPACPNLLFLLLSKRISKANKQIPESWKAKAPENVMFGTSLSMQKHVGLIDHLRKVNGKRFLSIEPQLERIEFEPWDLDGIDWVIQGGESGHGKRPFNVEWARLMRDQCKAYGVPYFFKQIDKIQEIPEDLMVREFPKI